ncbi:hypothetical protein P154DRAFT_542066 [Amniculicola lignicola CBS 123094]|uniref:D-xylulose reductase n=1 Tax=Amniculicola lignicola CBS 123094 TaxID=1392246 RepID=A0A6A5X2W0_9PLEO|nr:hypothetical protein P154DRAFT_542066 [Amniculicola lignicola CBS 123094]
MSLLHVFDLPQLHTKPSAEALLGTLSLLTSAPRSWDGSDAEGRKKPSASDEVQIDPEGVTRYLTSIISNGLQWIEDDEAKEDIWTQASQRLSERSGRTARGALSRQFRIPSGTGPFELTIHEPTLTADNLGLKTWAASYLLAKRLHHFDLVKPGLPKPQVLELGSGTGLVGLAMACLGANVVLTDLPNIYPNLARNAVDNNGLIRDRGGSTRSGILDWTKPTLCEIHSSGDANLGENASTLDVKFPLILAADSLYSPDHPQWLVDTIEIWLSKDEDAKVIVEFPFRTAYLPQLQDFRKRMENIGLHIEDEGEEKGYDDWGSPGTEEDDSDDSIVTLVPVEVEHKKNTMTQKNPSFILEKPGKVSYEDRPVPEIKSPYDVLVKPRWTGICGSDVHYWVHGRIGHFIVESPMVLGHESAGIVAQVGDKVSTVKVGDRVAIEPGVPCRMCPRCKEGNYNLCFDMRFAATPPYDGTLAGYYVVPEDHALKLPENVTLEEGALMEPTAVAVHIAKQASIKPGASVVVFGAGPVGLLCCTVAKAFGAKKIVTVDINEERLKFALKFAATHAFTSARVSAEENAKKMIEECELGPGADVIIDASGAEPCIQTAIYALRAGGTYVQGGMGKPDISFPIMAMCSKELTMKGCFRYGPNDYQTAIDLLAEGRISVKELITNKVKFEDAEVAFQDAKDGKGIKILIEGPTLPE